MHEITAYVPEDDGPMYRTAKGARRHELRMLLRQATLSMPSAGASVGARSDNDDLCTFLLDMLTSETYPTVADKLIEAIAYFKDHRPVLRGPGLGN